MNQKILRAAIYARYSTDKQSKESIEDQFHVCRQIAKREAFAVVARFHDREISGGTADRPDYQSMLDVARGHQFDIILVEDISRLTPNRAEYGPRSAEFEDLKIHMGADPVDSVSGKFRGTTTARTRARFDKAHG